MPLIPFLMGNYATADWTVLCEQPRDDSVKNLPAFASSYGYGALFDPIETAEEVLGQESYVNLLENPERFTGYSGPSAERVWKAIKEENCFGELTDVCLEKRIFYRLVKSIVQLFVSFILLGSI